MFKLSSVDLSPYYDYATCNTTLFLGMICHIIEVIDLHKQWDPCVFRVSYVISRLEHLGESCEHWGTLRNIGECCEHISSMQRLFHTSVRVFIVYTNWHLH